MILTLSTIVALIALLFIAALLRRPSVPQDWTPDLSVDRYRPMFRLLSEGDIRFLRSQPGATPALVRRLRKRRCQVFRGYLQSLERDFHGALRALSLVMVQSQSDRRDIVRTLIVSRMRFSLAVYRVRFRLLVYRWNMGQEPVTHMMNLFEGLQLELVAMAETPTAIPRPS